MTKKTNDSEDLSETTGGLDSESSQIDPVYAQIADLAYVHAGHPAVLAEELQALQDTCVPHTPAYRALSFALRRARERVARIQHSVDAEAQYRAKAARLSTEAEVASARAREAAETVRRLSAERLDLFDRRWKR